MTVKTKQFKIDASFNPATLNSFLAEVVQGGGSILDQFSVQLTPSLVNYYVIFDDAVPPEVIRTFPADGQANIPSGSDIIIIFNEDVILGTTPFEVLKEGAPVVGFTFTESSGRVEISGAIDVDIASYTVRVIRTQVTDLNLNQMIQDHTFAFTSSIDTLTGSFLTSIINASSSEVDADNVEPDPHLKRNIHSNFKRSAGSRMIDLGADGVYADNFFEDFSTDPGASYTPANTTAIVDTRRLKLDSISLGAAVTGVFYSQQISATGATGVLL